MTITIILPFLPPSLNRVAGRGPYNYRRAHAATNGNGAHAEVSGKESIASALGIEGKAKGALGCWIVCAEWENKNYCWHIKCVKAAAVDGEKIKADTWYMLQDGEFVEATDDED